MALTPVLQGFADVLHNEMWSNGAIELKESDPGSTIEPFRLTTSWPTLVVRFDGVPCNGMTINDRLFPFFKKGLPDVCKCCDYVILWQKNDSKDSPLYVLLTELKSGNTSGATAQIRNARLLVDYLLDVVRHHRRVDIPRDRVQYRGLTFTPRARAQPTGSSNGAIYQPSSSMPDLLLLTHRPCPNYSIEWFCTERQHTAPARR